MKIKTLLILIFPFAFPAIQAFAQPNEKLIYKDLKHTCRHLKQPLTEGDIPIAFFSADSLRSEKGIEIMQIMIIRHQKVDLPVQRNYTFREVSHYLEAYDTAKILPIEFPPVKIPKDESDTVFTSTLSRSVETARALFGEEIPVSQQPLFNEYKKPQFPLPWVSLPLYTWKFLSAAQWFLGAGNGNEETFSEGKKRAKSASGFLISKAEKQGTVILVGHGFFNYQLKKYLKRAGWKKVIDGKNKNLGVTLFVKIKS